jgi:hypothetical protein
MEDHEKNPGGEAGETTGQAAPPMLQPPRRAAGREAALSPFQYFALTQTGQSLDTSDPELWYAELDITTVSKEGIILGSEAYWAMELQPFVSGTTPHHKRPRLRIRYDCSHRARGVLQEILVYVVEESGHLRFICRAHPRQEAMAGLDLNLVFEYRTSYEAALRTMRSSTQKAYLGSKAGEACVRRLEERVKARRAWQRNRTKGGGKTRQAASDSAAAADAFSTELAEMIDGPADKLEAGGAASPQQALPEAAAGGADAAGHTHEGPVVEAAAESLDDLLGGPVGFQKKEDA